jgi:hypothetical protein
VFHPLQASRVTTPISSPHTSISCCYRHHHRSVLKNAVRAAIGPIATPDFIIYSDLPKVRPGWSRVPIHLAGSIAPLV